MSSSRLGDKRSLPALYHYILQLSLSTTVMGDTEILDASNLERRETDYQRGRIPACNGARNLTKQTLLTISICFVPPRVLTHWGRVTHISVSRLTIIGLDNGLSPDRRQAIIWTNAGILLIVRFGTNFSEILIDIDTFSFRKMHLKISFGK